MAVWDANGVTVVFPDGNETKVAGPLTADALKALVTARGIRKFTVSIDGESADSAMFPVSSGTVTIEEYNEAK